MSILVTSYKQIKSHLIGTCSRSPTKSHQSHLQAFFLFDPCGFWLIVFQNCPRGKLFKSQTVSHAWLVERAPLPLNSSDSTKAEQQLNTDQERSWKTWSTNLQMPLKHWDMEIEVPSSQKWGGGRDPCCISCQFGQAGWCHCQGCCLNHPGNNDSGVVDVSTYLSLKLFHVVPCYQGSISIKRLQTKRVQHQIKPFLHNPSPWSSVHGASNSASTYSNSCRSWWFNVVCMSLAYDTSIPGSSKNTAHWNDPQPAWQLIRQISQFPLPEDSAVAPWSHNWFCFVSRNSPECFLSSQKLFSSLASASAFAFDSKSSTASAWSQNWQYVSPGHKGNPSRSGWFLIYFHERHGKLRPQDKADCNRLTCGEITCYQSIYIGFQCMEETFDPPDFELFKWLFPWISLFGWAKASLVIITSGLSLSLGHVMASASFPWTSSAKHDTSMR